jgi:hypothetical protein
VNHPHSRGGRKEEVNHEGNHLFPIPTNSNFSP